MVLLCCAAMPSLIIRNTFGTANVSGMCKMAQACLYLYISYYVVVISDTVYVLQRVRERQEKNRV